jgi:hypothetical protein
MMESQLQMISTCVLVTLLSDDTFTVSANSAAVSVTEHLQLRCARVVDLRIIVSASRRHKIRETTPSSPLRSRRRRSRADDEHHRRHKQLVLRLRGRHACS